MNDARHRPRLTPKGERTRARIVGAAAGLIYERGVAGTTLEDVRAAAEVSGSQLYHYFADKDELVQRSSATSPTPSSETPNMQTSALSKDSEPGATWSSPRLSAPTAKEAAPSGH